MRLAPILILALLLAAPTVQAQPCEGEGSPLMGELLISAVMPVHSSEFVCILNNGGSVVRMGGLTVTDGEGILTIPEGTVLEPGEELVIASGEQTFLDPEGRQFMLISEMERWGSFILADRGDWVHIMDGDVVLDTFVYGDVDRLLPGWDGPPFDRIGRCQMAVRLPGEDSDTRWDWTVTVPGRSEHPERAFMAEVQGFLFPDEGFDIIMRELSMARSSVLLSLYYLDNGSVMSLLSKLAGSGVEVRVLLEGAPVGGISESTAARLMTMAEEGVEIHLLRSADGYKRYDYMHSKYAVVDGRTLMMTSENWRTSAFESNRGWGALASSSALASHMAELFHLDHDLHRHDVHCVLTYYSYLDPEPLPSPSPVDGGPRDTVLSKVTVVTGPEHGRGWLQGLFESATERIYSQQFYCQASWAYGDGVLQWMRDAGARNVDSRLLLDSTFMGDSGGRNAKVAAAFDGWEGCSARLWEGEREFSLQHNKGLVVDDAAVISTFNWVDASFDNNRENALVIESAEIASMFADAFLLDWSPDPYPPTAVLDWEDRTYRAGEMVLLTANRSHDNVAVTGYHWDLNGDGEADREGSRVMHSFPAGEWECTLWVYDAEGNSDHVRFTVTVEEEASVGGSAYLPLAGLSAALLAWRAAVLRRRRASQTSM